MVNIWGGTKAADDHWTLVGGCFNNPGGYVPSEHPSSNVGCKDPSINSYELGLGLYVNFSTIAAGNKHTDGYNARQVAKHSAHLERNARVEPTLRGTIYRFAASGIQASKPAHTW